MKLHSVTSRRLRKMALAAPWLLLLWVPVACAQKPVGTSPPTQVQTPKPPVVQPAIDGIFSAFKTRPLIGMSDAHGLAQQEDFYAALVRDPRFAREVGNVVVEFGTASHQAIIDRYVAGEEVPYGELRKVWTDPVGWDPAATYLGFANFFAAVRATNLTLPPDQHIRVWLGDPPVDWSIATKSDIDAALERRDSYPAQLIMANILSKDKKALVIYGGAHLSTKSPHGAKPRSTPNIGAEATLRKMLADVARGAPDYSVMSPELADQVRKGLAAVQADLAPRGAILAVSFKSGDDSGRDTFIVTFTNGDPMTIAMARDAQGRLARFGPEFLNLREDVERRYPNSFFIVWPHRGGAQGCSQSFEGSLKGWPVPALATAVDGSSLEAALRKGDCTSVSSSQPLWFDGYLYLGPVAALVRSPMLSDLYLDGAYRAEIARRQPLKGVGPLPLTVDMDKVSATPRPWQSQ